MIQGPVDIDPGQVAECGFTPISGTRFSQYDCNPVFTGADGESFVSVGFRTQEVLGHPFYQIWYSHNRGADGWGMGYAVSDDGTSWQTNANNPVVRSKDTRWDQNRMDAMQLIWDDSRKEYVLWYQGFTYGDGFLDPGVWGVGIKTSPNGVDWSDLQGNGMIMDLSTPGANGVDYCWPLGVTWTLEDGYSGFLAGGQAGGLLGQPTCETYAFRGSDLEDPSSFKFDSNPILAAGPERYDAAGHASLAMVPWAEDEYYLFYTSFEAWENQPDGSVSSSVHHFNYATSSDGKNWDKSPQNPLPINNQPEKLVRDVAAQRYGSRILLWISDTYTVDGTNVPGVGFFYFEPDIEPHP